MQNWLKRCMRLTNTPARAHHTMQIPQGKTAYAGALVRGGEATGMVTATGARTFFGKTAELVRTAHPPIGRSTRSSASCATCSC